MTLESAHSFLEEFLAERSKRSEQKLGTEFLHILQSLEERKLSSQEIEQIEKELDVLALETLKSTSRRKLAKDLNQFKKHLRENFSLITVGYYTERGLALGMCLGLAFGSIFGGAGLSVGLGMGALIGIIVGRSLEAKAKAEGQLI